MTREDYYNNAIKAVEALETFGTQTTPQELRDGANLVSADYMDGFNTALGMAVAAIELVRGPLAPPSPEPGDSDE